MEWNIWDKWKINQNAVWGGRLSISTAVLKLRYLLQREASDPVRKVGIAFWSKMANF